MFLREIRLRNGRLSLFFLGSKPQTANIVSSNCACALTQVARNSDFGKS